MDEDIPTEFLMTGKSEMETDENLLKETKIEPKAIEIGRIGEFLLDKYLSRGKGWGFRNLNSITSTQGEKNKRSEKDRIIGKLMRTSYFPMRYRKRGGSQDEIEMDYCFEELQLVREYLIDCVASRQSPIDYFLVRPSDRKNVYRPRKKENCIFLELKTSIKGKKQYGSSYQENFIKGMIDDGMHCEKAYLNVDLKSNVEFQRES